MNGGYIELKDIRNDKVKTKSKRILKGIWTATREVFGFMGKILSRMWKNLNKPREQVKHKPSKPNQFKSMMAQMADNLDSWEQAEQESLRPKKANKKKKIRGKPKKQESSTLPSSDFWKKSDDYW